MIKVIVASGAVFPVLYAAYFYYVVKRRLEADRKARAQKRQNDSAK